ncbi:MAG: hypothetical protein PVJ78_07525, partial [Gammaproteobacteria bacterium]
VMADREGGTQTFDPSSKVDNSENTIELAAEHGYTAGDALVYNNGGGTSIGGLNDGQTYYVIAVDGEPNQIKLAATVADAQAGDAVSIDKTPATGSSHTLTDRSSDFESLSISGAGTADVGLAGSFALNRIDNTTEAVVAGIVGAGNGTDTTDDDDVSVEAQNFSLAGAEAKSKVDGNDSDAGVGASGGFNFVDNTTRALLAASGEIDDADDIGFSAEGRYALLAGAEVGAAGADFTLTPAVAMSFADNVTEVDLQAGTLVTLSGDLEAEANSRSDSLIDVDGTAAAGDAAFGASVAVSDVDDFVTASTMRDITSGGAVTLRADAGASSNADALASVTGASSDPAESRDANTEADQQVGFGREQSGDSPESMDEQQDREARTADGAVGIAAAVSVNLADVEVEASIAGGTINAGGLVTVESKSNTDAASKADGSAQTDQRVEFDAQLDAKEFETAPPPREFDASTAVDTDDESIDLGAGHGFSVGDKVRYDRNGNTAITGLTDGKVYFVVSTTDNKIKLSLTEGGGAENLSGTPSGTHNLVAVTGKEFDASSASIVDNGDNSIDLGADHGFKVGDKLLYNSNAETEVSGLISGDEYYVVDVTGNKIKLSATKGGSVIGLNTGTGTQNLSLVTVDTDENAINLGSGHKLKVNDEVQYDRGAGAAITGLTTTTKYFVAEVDGQYVKLKETEGGSVIGLTSEGTGTQKLTPSAVNQADDTISLGSNHGLSVGDEIKYIVGDGGEAIGGLTDGTNYFVVDTSGTRIKVSTEEGGSAVDLTGSGKKSQRFVPVEASGSSGVAAGVAINVIETGNLALIASAANVTGEGIKVSTGMADVDGDTTSKFESESISGAGAADVGVAGSFSFNRITNTSEALIAGTVDAGAGAADDDVVIEANSVSLSRVDAKSKVDNSDADAGFGASVGLNFTDNITRAAIQDAAVVTDANDINLGASSKHSAKTRVEMGTAGSDVSITPAVGITFADNDTSVSIGTGSDLALSGDLGAVAKGKGNSSTTVDGTTAGSDAALGAAVAITNVDDTVEAHVYRNVISGGAVTLKAENSSTSNATAKASSKGASTEASAEGSTNPTESRDANTETNRQLDTANDQTGNTGTDDEAESPEQETSDGAVGFAAAISVNLADSVTLASVEADITADGMLTVEGLANTDANSTADGSAKTDSDGTSVGLAVAVNVPNTTNLAEIPGGVNVVSDGLTVRAGMLEREISLTPKEHPVVDIEKDTIFIDEARGLTTGDEVYYFDGDLLSDQSIGGLDDNPLKSLYVIVLGEGKIQLATSEDNAKNGIAIDLTSAGTGTGHTFERITFDDVLEDLDPVELLKKIVSPIIEFDAAGNYYEIEIGDNTGLVTGDALNYDNGDDDDIGGLVDGETYYAIVENNGKLKLAASYQDAIEGKKIKLTGKGTSGEGHKVTEASHSTFTHATSGASGGDIGVAGSVAIDYATGNTSAIIADGANIALADGNMDASIGAVEIDADSTSNNLTKADPKRTTAGTSVGVGLSFAINIGQQDTNAIIENNAVLTGADDVSLSADGNHVMLTEAKAGSKGGESGTAVGGSVALSISDNDNLASVGTGSALDVDGDLVINASNSNTQTTKSDADTEGAETGVGIAFALGVVEDDTSAELKRDVSTGAATADDVSVTASSDVDARTRVWASATGAAKEEDGGNTADQETTNQTGHASTASGTSIESPTPGNRVDDANDEAATQTTDPGGQGGVGEEGTTETQGGSVRVAAAIGATVVTPDVSATVIDGLTIDADGDMAVKALSEVDADTQAIGLAHADDAETTVGAAVAVNVGVFDTSATVGDGNIATGSLSVEAGTSETRATFDAATAVDTAPSAETIDLGADHGLSVGDAVVYSAEGGTGIGGLEDGETYYVVDVSGNTVKLSEEEGGDAIDLTSAGSGTQSLTLTRSNDFKTLALSGSGSTQKGENDNTAFAGAVGVNVVVSNTTASIADGATVGATAGNVDVLARQDIGIQNIAGGGALTLSDDGTSVGASIGVNYVDSTTIASVGADSDIDASGNVSAVADASITPLEIVVPIIDEGLGVSVTSLVVGAAIGSGGDAGAGSAAINVFTPVTRASIGADADIDAGGDVTVRAVDDTRIVDFAGTLAGSKDGAGVGIGLDVTVVTKTTEAIIGAPDDSTLTQIDAGGNVTVEADSLEDYWQLTANIGAGDSTSGAGGANVLVNLTTTRALLGRDPVADPPQLGNVVVDAGGSVVVA